MAVEVKGTKELVAQAEAGLKLFKEAELVEGDADAAQAFKEEQDAKLKALEDEAATLTGKDNKKARSEKSKEAAAIKKTDQYIDAERVLKGLEPKHGFFLKGGAKQAAAAPTTRAQAAPTEVLSEAKGDTKAKKEVNKSKKADCAGISGAERDELDRLKGDIISMKARLKGEGMSGGQINKHEQIVEWVARMNELKERECPGSTAAGKKDDKQNDKKPGKRLSAEQERDLMTLERDIDEYRKRLQDEFRYTKKEIQADPDMVDMVARLNKLTGKK